MRRRRRQVIRDARARRLVAIVAFGLVGLGAPLCLVRVARLWFVPLPGGGSDFRRLMIEHGTLVYEQTDNPAGTPGGGPVGQPGRDPILNWQLDPGLSFEYRHTLRRLPAMGGGTVVEVTRVIPVAGPMVVVAGGLLLLILPLVRVPPGECECGYPLEGISGDRCPECGVAAMLNTES